MQFAKFGKLRKGFPIRIMQVMIKLSISWERFSSYFCETGVIETKVFLFNRE